MLTKYFKILLYHGDKIGHSSHSPKGSYSPSTTSLIIIQILNSCQEICQDILAKCQTKYMA